MVHWNNDQTVLEKKKVNVQDLVNALLLYPPTMEVFSLREDMLKVSERYTPIETVIIGEAAIGSEKDKDGNDKAIYKQAILVKALTKEIKNG